MGNIYHFFPPTLVLENTSFNVRCYRASISNCYKSQSLHKINIKETATEIEMEET